MIEYPSENGAPSRHDARTALPLFEDLKQKDASKISDAEILLALQEMAIVNPTVRRPCDMRHEIYDLRDFCPDEGLLTCPHSHAFKVIQEAIDRCKRLKLADSSEVHAQTHLLLRLRSKLDDLDTGGTYIQQEIDSGGRSGNEVLPAYLELIGVTREQLLAVPAGDAKALVSAKIGPLQLAIGKDTDAIRRWAINTLSQPHSDAFSAGGVVTRS